MWQSHGSCAYGEIVMERDGVFAKIYELVGAKTGG